jgi:hypothetical protein
MKRFATLVHEITQNQVRIKILRSDQARIDAEIETLTLATKASVVDLLGRQLDFGQLAIEDLLAALSKFAAIPPPGRATDVLVRLSANTGSSNRSVLATANLHWNGRRQRWTGSVSEDQLVRLRERFGDRVEDPAQAAAAQDTGPGVEAAPVHVSADVKAIVDAVEGNPGPADADGSPSASAATSLRLPFGGFPVRRSEP